MDSTSYEQLIDRDAIEQVGNALAAETQSRFHFLKKFWDEKLGKLRPLTEFFDKDRIRYTSSFGETGKRLSHNLQHFAVNYLLIMAGLAMYADHQRVVITHYCLIVGGLYLIYNLDGHLTLGTHISPRYLYSLYCGVMLALLLFSGATGAIFWITGTAVMVVLSHAVLLEPGLEGEFGSDGQV